MQIPFNNFKRQNNKIKNNLNQAYQRVINSGSFILSDEVSSFEKEFAKYSGAKYCVGVGNGLDALHFLLLAYNIGPGDEVIVPSNTFIATWLAVTQCGATPVPAEPNINTYNIDPEYIEKLITRRTKAIIPVHLYGQPANMDLINIIAVKHKLIVIEDAAQAQGACYKGRRVGSLAHGAATSFYPGKNLGAIGDGGAVLTKDEKIANKIRQLRSYGAKIKYKHNIIGFNSRLDELQAAFLRCKLKLLDKWNIQRNAVAKKYHKSLSDTEIILPLVPNFADPVWHLYVIRCKKRNKLKTYLEKKGISTIIHYPTPPHRQKCYADLNHLKLPIADTISNEALSLPIYPTLTINEIDFICEQILKFYKKNK
jgi:dTDP-4-amino-4,6-dideoxygalactose transaminase